MGHKESNQTKSLSIDIVKGTTWYVPAGKTKISLHIQTVWSDSLVTLWLAKVPMILH